MLSMIVLPWSTGWFHHQNFSDLLLNQYRTFGVSCCMQMLFMITSSYSDVNEIMMAVIMTQQRWAERPSTIHTLCSCELGACEHDIILEHRGLHWIYRRRVWWWSSWWSMRYCSWHSTIWWILMGACSAKRHGECCVMSDSVWWWMWWRVLWREACLCRTVWTLPHVHSQYFST